MTYQGYWCHQSNKEGRIWKVIITETPTFWRLSTVGWNCRKGKQCTTRGSFYYPCKNKTYGEKINSNVRSVFASTGFRFWMQSSFKDSQISCLTLYVRLRQYFGPMSASKQSTAEVCPSVITHLHTVSLTLSGLSRVSERMTYVQHIVIPFLLTTYDKPRTRDWDCERLSLIPPGWNLHQL